MPWVEFKDRTSLIRNQPIEDFEIFGKTFFQSRKSLIYFFKMPFRDSTLEMTDVLVRILKKREKGEWFSSRSRSWSKLDWTVFEVYSPCPESDDVHMSILATPFLETLQKFPCPTFLLLMLIKHINLAQFYSFKMKERQWVFQFFYVVLMILKKNLK